MPAGPVNLATAEVEVEPPSLACLGKPKGGSSAATEPSINDEEEEEESGGEEDSVPTPTLLSMRSPAISYSSAASSSPSISPSSSITTDTSVASDTHHGNIHSNKNIHEGHKVAKQSAGLNNVASLDPGEVDVDLNRIESTTIITGSTSASPTPSTPRSSSSTSLPPPTPCGSSASTSTSPSTTNVNDLGVDLNGLMSLLRPRPQINNQNLNVKFAPLPELAPRRRKSSTPLGMAARSQLARRRRMTYQDSYDDYEAEDDPYRRRPSPPKFSEGETEAGAEGVNPNGGKKKAKKQGEDGERKVKRDGEQEDEDPLAMLAKKMGRAGKHLWRRMASGGKIEKDGAGGGKGGVGEIAAGTTNGDIEQREGEEQGQGEGWIEEVSEECRKIQETRAKESIEVEASLYPAMTTPLPPSKPSSPTNDTPTGACTRSSHELSEAGSTHEGDSTFGGKVNSFPATPSIVVSAA